MSGGATGVGDVARLRARLLQRIHRQYQTVTQTVRVDGLELEFTRIKDPDVVLDLVAAEEDRREKVTGERHNDQELHLPYWAELWDSSLAMGQFLLSSVPTAYRQPPAALDLGCGMGLSGTVAAALGSEVTFADLETPALLFASLNSLPYRERVRVRRLNWRKDTLKQRFGLIIGADIVYDRQEWQYLEPFWREHLAPGGAVLLGEPGRQTGDLFPQWIEQRGWTLEPFEQPVATRPRPVRIFRLARA